MKNKRERERNNNPTKKKKKKKKKKEREREKIRKRSFDVINGLFALCLTGTDVCRARDRKFLLWISDGGVSNDGCQIHVANWSVCKHGRLAAKRTPRRSEEGHVHAHTHAHTHTHTSRGKALSVAVDRGSQRWLDGDGDDGCMFVGLDAGNIGTRSTIPCQWRKWMLIGRWAERKWDFIEPFCTK